jgi:hypothetical protein
MMQVPSDARVIVVVPSGPLDDEIELLVEPLPVVTDPADVLAVTSLPDVPVEVVTPFTVVDDETLPPPAVTEDDSPLPADLPSMTVHFSPVSVVVSSSASAGPQSSAPSPIVRTPLLNVDMLASSG